MLRDFLFVSKIMFSCISTFKKGNKSSIKKYLTGKTLLEKTSYRLPHSSSHDHLIGIRVLYRSLKDLWSRSGKSTDKASEGNVLIFDGLKKSNLLRRKYVEAQENVNVSHFIAKSDLLLNQNNKKIHISVLIILVSIPYVIKCLISSEKRSNYALLITELVENVLIYSWLKRNTSITHVYDFCPFEKDSNLLSLLCEELGKIITKFPSPVPIFLHNHTTICDRLVLTNPYQFDELPELNNTIITSEVAKWIPEYALDYMDIYYQRESKKIPINTIGYYSHGSWLRHKSGDAKTKINVYHAENQLLKDIKLIFNGNKKLKLIIYPHPKEKSKENKNDMLMYYKKALDGINYELFTDNTRTSECFDQVDIALTTFSSIIFERLFCGFKTIICPYGIDSFPIRTSSLNNITARNLLELEKMIELMLIQSKNSFFTENNIADYHYSKYPYYSKKN